MVRRYYRIRPLTSIDLGVVDGLSTVTAEYDYEGSHIHVVAVHARHERIDSSLVAIRSVATAIPPGDEIVAELVVWREGTTETADQTSRVLLDAINGILGEPSAASHRRVGVRPGRRDGYRGSAALHLPSRRGGRLHRADAVPRPPSDDGQASSALAPRCIRYPAADDPGGHLPVPRGGAQQPARRTAGRAGGGAGSHTHQRRRRAGGPPTGFRAHVPRRPRVDSSIPGPAP